MLDGSMRIEVLFFDGCPNYEALLPHLRSLLCAGGFADARIDLLRVTDAETAQRERFLGSPTVRVSGEDVEPGAGARSDFGLKCRLFASPRAARRARGRVGAQRAERAGTSPCGTTTSAASAGVSRGYSTRIRP